MCEHSVCVAVVAKIHEWKRSNMVRSRSFVACGHAVLCIWVGVGLCVCGGGSIGAGCYSVTNANEQQKMQPTDDDDDGGHGVKHTREDINHERRSMGGGGNYN